jgi:hypothetical protein
MLPGFTCSVIVLHTFLPVRLPLMSAFVDLPSTGFRVVVPIRSDLLHSVIKPRRKTLAFKRRDTRRVPSRQDGRGGKPLVSGFPGAKKSGTVWACSSVHTATGAIQRTSNNRFLLALSVVRAGSTTGHLRAKAGPIKREASASRTTISPPACLSSNSNRRRLGSLRFLACPYNKACAIWIVPSSISSRGEGNTRASSRKSEAARRRPTPLLPSPGGKALSRWQQWTPRSRIRWSRPPARESDPLDGHGKEW